MKKNQYSSFEDSSSRGIISPPNIPPPSSNNRFHNQNRYSLVPPPPSSRPPPPPPPPYPPPHSNNNYQSFQPAYSANPYLSHFSNHSQDYHNRNYRGRRRNYYPRGRRNNYQQNFGRRRRSELPSDQLDRKKNIFEDSTYGSDQRRRRGRGRGRRRRRKDEGMVRNFGPKEIKNWISHRRYHFPKKKKQLSNKSEIGSDQTEFSGEEKEKEEKEIKNPNGEIGDQLRIRDQEINEGHENIQSRTPKENDQFDNKFHDHYYDENEESDELVDYGSLLHTRNVSRSSRSRTKKKFLYNKSLREEWNESPGQKKKTKKKKKKPPKPEKDVEEEEESDDLYGLGEELIPLEVRRNEINKKFRIPKVKSVSNNEELENRSAQNSMYSVLMSDQKQRETDVISQCFHYIIQNNFFATPEEIENFNPRVKQLLKQRNGNL